MATKLFLRSARILLEEFGEKSLENCAKDIREVISGV